MSTGLVGRTAEVREIDDLIEGAREGRGSALLLRGEPGIGKTSLLRYAAAHASALTLLEARGIEAESEIPFSGLSDLLRPLLGALSTLPARQAAALAGALALGPPTGADPFAVAAATLSLLAAAAAERPVLVLVDDLQWLDTSSSEALLFAARRLDAEPLAMLFAEREGGEAEHPAPGFSIRRIAGLDRVEALELLAAVTDRSLPADVAERLYAASGGNPLALVELPGLLSGDLLEELDALADAPLPLSDRMVRVFSAQVAGLPSRIRTALLLAAANDGMDADPVLAALPGLGLDRVDIERAEATGLLAIDGPGARFRHPLVRSSVYQGADPAQRREAHRALADALAGHDDAAAARRAWHLAAATLGHDDGVAAALERAAVAARHRGGYAAAARTWERAARLSSADEARARRLLAAAQALELANRYERAMALLDEARRLTGDPLLAADIEHERARIDVWRGPALDACARLREVAEALRETSPGRSAAMLTDATLAGITGGDLGGAVVVARRAYEIAGAVGGRAEVRAALQLGKAQILTGDVHAGYPRLMGAVTALLDDDALADGADLVQASPALLAVEEYDQAERVLLRQVSAERASSAVGRLAYSLGALAELEVRIGRWAAAAAHGSEAVQLAEEAGLAGQLSYNLARFARLEAGRGQETACRAHVARALELAGRHNFGSTWPFAYSALGLLALGLDRPSEAVLHLEETGRQWERIGLREPGRLEWQGDLAEALVRNGQAPDAERVLAELERRSAACCHDDGDGRQVVHCTLARAVLARCRGLAAGGPEADALFCEALAWHERSTTPFQRARTQLCFGEHLRRRGRRVEARPLLRAAEETFDQLRAAPWAERASAALAATGEQLGPRRARPIDALTPQEMQVALVVGDGATNREAAAALFLTPKTIEFHLARIYRKLELRSRSELARWVAVQQGAQRG